MTVFDEATLRKLEQLTLVADRVRAGMMKGDRRSKKRGSSIEFADYRNYVKGDDLRRLDWNVYARLERPFIKLLEEEEDLAVHILVDGSQSMDWPPGGESTAETHKLQYALRVAGALGHIALGTGDLLNVTLLRSVGNVGWGPYRGRQSSLRLFQFLDSHGREPAGLTDLNHALHNYALRARRPGLCLIITDLLSPNGYATGFNALQSRGYEVALLHLLTREEIEPPILGDIKLIDAETGQGAEISLDSTTVANYRARVESWQAEAAAYCHGRGAHYLPIITDEPWERFVLQQLRQQRIIR